MHLSSYFLVPFLVLLCFISTLLDMTLCNGFYALVQKGVGDIDELFLFVVLFLTISLVNLILILFLCHSILFLYLAMTLAFPPFVCHVF
jgi:hypothetical protein